MNPSPQNRRIWRSLEDWAAAPDFERRLADEFPQGASAWEPGLSRRRFLELLASSFALAGLSGCVRPPDEKILPYVEQPEKLIPGVPLHYATTLRVRGFPRGVVVTQQEGRPTHIEGNRLHPMSEGATDIWTTAAILDLYDPDRAQAVLHENSITTWDQFQEAMTAWRAAASASGGRGFCLLTPPLDSPAVEAQVARLLAMFPQARHYQQDPLGTASPPLGEDGIPLRERLNLADADVIFSLESDFLFDRPDSLALTRAFARRRRSEACNRLYVAESCPSVTGARADHRFSVSPADGIALATSLLKVLQGGTPDARWPWLAALADDLRSHAGRGAVLGGPSLPGAARGTLHEVNRLLGNLGKTISYHRSGSVLPKPGSLDELTAQIRANGVETLLILGGNPVYTAPIDFDFGTLLRRVPMALHHTLYANETSAACAWVLPAAHDLESWGDARADDGTESIRQPLIAPLYEGRSELEVISFLVDSTGREGHALLRETRGSGKLPPEAFEDSWHRWLRDGVVAGMPVSAPVAEVRFTGEGGMPDAALWLNFRPDPSVWDGAQANNAWLQEMPDPITKLTWDNAALIAPATAVQHGLNDGDVVALQSGGIRLETPVLIVPGHAEGGVTLRLGYGRTAAGRVGNGVGVNAYALRRGGSSWIAPLESLEKIGKRHSFAITQQHQQMEDRDLVRISDANHPPTPVLVSPAPASLYPEVPYLGRAWAMTIDLGTCIGCNACMIACQSENNIPVVGKEQVAKGREMHWIRVDRYYQGPPEAPETHFQPVPCMHCEKAPCEVVCPVGATLHSDEGLNEMVYNRCVGTRYCSNNCPYKVRRFNFLEFNAKIAESEKLHLNPNVTVRSRGVMEKCTYCVQRIETARIAADREQQPFTGQGIITACQSACPAEAIVFGDLSDPQSAVSQNRKRAGHYALLEELDTRPRTTYLSKLVNPNPALPSPA